MMLKVAKRGEWRLLKFRSSKKMIFLPAQYFHGVIVKFILSEAEGSLPCTFMQRGNSLHQSAVMLNLFQHLLAKHN